MERGKATAAAPAAGRFLAVLVELEGRTVKAGAICCCCCIPFLCRSDPSTSSDTDDDHALELEVEVVVEPNDYPLLAL